MKYIPKHSLKLLFIISIFFGIIVQVGFYGYNIDFYKEYYKPNLYYHVIFDRLGAYLATLTIYNIRFGVILTTTFLSISCGFFILKCFEFYLKKEKKFDHQKILIVFLVIFITTLHTHPIIMSTSGAMRQGWAMILLFLSLSFLFNQKLFVSVFLIIFSLFMLNLQQLILYIIFLRFLLFSFQIDLSKNL